MHVSSGDMWPKSVLAGGRNVDGFCRLGPPPPVPRTGQSVRVRLRSQRHALQPRLAQDSPPRRRCRFAEHPQDKGRSLPVPVVEDLDGYALRRNMVAAIGVPGRISASGKPRLSVMRWLLGPTTPNPPQTRHERKHMLLFDTDLRGLHRLPY